MPRFENNTAKHLFAKFGIAPPFGKLPAGCPAYRKRHRKLPTANRLTTLALALSSGLKKTRLLVRRISHRSFTDCRRGDGSRRRAGSPGWAGRHQESQESKVPRSAHCWYSNRRHWLRNRRKRIPQRHLRARCLAAPTSSTPNPKCYLPIPPETRSLARLPCNCGAK